MSLFNSWHVFTHDNDIKLLEQHRYKQLQPPLKGGLLLGKATHPARRISCRSDQWQSHQGRSQWWKNPVSKEAFKVRSRDLEKSWLLMALHPNLDSYRTGHEATPRLGQEVATGSRKHSHQLLQRFKLHTTTTRQVVYALRLTVTVIIELYCNDE